MKGSESSTWSNAFNFQKTSGTQVEPRTGTLSAYVKVGSLISNLEHGPNIDLKVNYNSNSSADPDGLSRGWSWNLTHFDLVNNQLFTSQGQSFNLQQNDQGHWWPRYHKLHDIQINGTKDTHFVITYANGLRETLNHDGYETRLEQQDGRGVSFLYLSGTHLLSSVSDNQGHKIVLNRDENYLTVTSNGNEEKPANVRIYYSEYGLQVITLHDDTHQDESSVYMAYSDVNHLLTKITYPTGLNKSIEYDCKDAMKLPLQNDVQGMGLCMVTKQVVNSGVKQPNMVTHYTGQTSNNEHNYLAFNSGLSMVLGIKQDILFEAPVITREDYTFNALNRMTQVKEALIDTTQQKTLNKLVNYGYGNAQIPLR